MTNSRQINASVRTDPGRVRDHNEDYVAVLEPESLTDEYKNGWLYIVADGVGGADAGEVASKYATEQTIKHYLADQEKVDWAERLVQAMQSANADLRKLVADKGDDRRMATTMVAAILYENTAILANVGDSRGYHWRNGTFRQITKDQSLVARLLEEGAITEEEAINHPRKNIILHSLGSENDPKIDLYHLQIETDEQIILCSDGLTRHVSDDEIAEAIAEKKPQEATAKLLQLANERGGEDNISVAVLHIGERTAQIETEIRQNTQVEIASDTVMLSPNEVDVSRKALSTYTVILCTVQTILIILIWFIINR
jgi:protein phosphatase